LEVEVTGGEGLGDVGRELKQREILPDEAAHGAAAPCYTLQQPAQDAGRFGQFSRVRREGRPLTCPSPGGVRCSRPHRGNALTAFRRWGIRSRMRAHKLSQIERTAAGEANGSIVRCWRRVARMKFTKPQNHRMFHGRGILHNYCPSEG
jgi:hypothetical protein